MSSDCSMSSILMLLGLLLLLLSLVYILHYFNVYHKVHVFVTTGYKRHNSPLLLPLQVASKSIITNSQGREPNSAFVYAILDLPVPTNVAQVTKFLEMLNFYSEFLPDLSTYAKSLRLLSDENFLWSTECQVAFELLKHMLVSSLVLPAKAWPWVCQSLAVRCASSTGWRVPLFGWTEYSCITLYDPSLPLVLAVDASPIGVGAVLSHAITFKGRQVERPVMFASATLTPTQQNYAPLEREGLAVVFGTLTFHKFLREQFTLVTDNSAIQQIFQRYQCLPIGTSHRLRHWMAVLHAYNYEIVLRKSECMSVPDALSCLPIDVTINEDFF